MEGRKNPTIKDIIYLLIFLAGFPLFAQQSFEPGYIITSENDTIRGRILDATDAELSTKILFRSEEGSIAKEYKPEDLIGFGFNSGRTFERKSIISKTEKETDTSFVFAKNLVRGKIDMFVLRFPHRLKPDIFLTNNSTNKTVHLSKPEKREVIGKDGKKYTGKDYRYAGNLALIKGDSTVTDEEPIKYSEKKIKNEILSYNENFQQEYSVKEYEEEVNYNYDVIVGIPLKSTDGLHFRTGIYRNKTNVERTRNFSLMQGIVYHHWSEKEREIPDLRNVESNFRWQLLNFIPLAINFHGDSGIVRPYGYAGVGFAVGMLTDRVIEDYIYTGDETDFIFLPTFNLGLGVKFKVGNYFLITEFTPTINGTFINLGFSF